MANVPLGVGQIDAQLIAELNTVAQAINQTDIKANPRKVHAVVLFFKDREPQLFVCKNDDLNELESGVPYPPVENTTLIKADQVGLVLYADAQGQDPSWYYLNGRRMHSP